MTDINVNKPHLRYIYRIGAAGRDVPSVIKILYDPHCPEDLLGKWLIVNDHGCPDVTPSARKKRAFNGNVSIFAPKKVLNPGRRDRQSSMHRELEAKERLRELTLHINQFLLQPTHRPYMRHWPVDWSCRATQRIGRFDGPKILARQGSPRGADVLGILGGDSIRSRFLPSREYDPRPNQRGKNGQQVENSLCGSSASVVEIATHHFDTAPGPSNGLDS